MVGLLISIAAMAIAPAAQTGSAQLSREEVEQILFDFRPGVDWKLKEANVERLARTGETYLPLLIECLRWELPAWLKARIEESRKGERPLAMRADGSGVGVQSWAEKVLLKIGKPAVPLLVASVESQPETVGTAARILGNIGDKQAIPPLISILKEAKWNWANRASAAHALELLNAQEAIPDLIESLRGQVDDSYNSDKLADSAANALVGLTGRSFGFIFVLRRTDMEWGLTPKYAFVGSPDERERTISRWKQWWERHTVLVSEAKLCLAKYGEQLKSGNHRELQAMRSPDYVRRIRDSRGGLVLAENPRDEWFDMVQGQSGLISPVCNDYQISLLECRDEDERAVVTTQDTALLVVDGRQVSFVVTIERVLKKQGDSLVVSEENLLKWERSIYGG